MKTPYFRRYLQLFLFMLTSLLVFSAMNSYAADAAPSQPAAAPAQEGSASVAKTEGQVQAIAQVVWVKGEVSAVGTDNKSRILKRRDFIYAHETISTSKEGSGEIVFTDSSLLTLKEDTQLKIDEYKFSKDGPANENKFVANMAKGGFRTITGAISKSNPENYKVATPVATIGVRGTKYVIAFDAHKKLAVGIEQGSIVVKNQAGHLVLSPSDNVYSQISSSTQAPMVMKSPPAEFKTIPATTYAVPTPELQKASMLGTSSVTGAGGAKMTSGSSPGGAAGAKSTSTPSSSGGSKTVNNFTVCN